MRIDPWSSSPTVDYARLRDEFGIEPLGPLTAKLPDPPKLFRRGVVFGHRGFERVAHAIERGEPWAVLTGLMPSGPMHFGHKMVVDQIAYYQSLGADVTITVADIEAYATRGLTLERCREIAQEYIENYLALGLSTERLHVYFQSERRAVKDLAWRLGKYVTWSQMQSIYGFEGATNLAHVQAPLVQVGDILHVQLPEFGGTRPVVVPVGVDQDPHIRLTRDLADATRQLKVASASQGLGLQVAIAGAGQWGTLQAAFPVWLAKHPPRGKDEDALRVAALKELAHEVVHVVLGKELGFDERGVSVNAPYGVLSLPNATATDLPAVDAALARHEQRVLGGFGFLAPAATYHRFMSGLTGGKMSSSRPESHVALLDPPEAGRKKMAAAVTGGKSTAEEQRRTGADPDVCVAFEMYTFHTVEDDGRLARVNRDCRSGAILCGECKKANAVDAVGEYLTQLEKRRAEARASGAAARVVRP